MDSVSYIKKALRLAFSVSILSSFILFCSSLLPLVIYYFQSTYNKNYMFLLCNGILGFILKISGLTTRQFYHDYVEEDHQQDKSIKDFANQQCEVPPYVEVSSKEEKTTPEFDNSLALVPTKEGNENDELLIAQDDEVEEQRNEIVLIDEEEDALVPTKEGNENDELLIAQDDEVEEQRNEMVLIDEEEEEECPEELNRRFDDFIKMMKSKMRAQ